MLLIQWGGKNKQKQKNNNKKKTTKQKSNEMCKHTVKDIIISIKAFKLGWINLDALLCACMQSNICLVKKGCGEH